MGISRIIGRTVGMGALAAALLAAGGCTSIKDRRGYLADAVLYNSIQPGIDNQRSVEATLGRPTFTSQFGQPTWYYVAGTTGQRPFGRPKIEESSVMALTFDASGNVATVDRRNDLSQVVYLNPERRITPTLGRERGFLEDLFGNIGAVGAAGAGPGAQGPNG